MKLSLNNNITQFDSIKDHDYFFNKDHKLRAEIVTELINEVINKKAGASQKLLSIACSSGVIEEEMKK